MILSEFVIEYAQAVRDIYERVPARKWSEEENRTNKIVFIGHISFLHHS
jgi:G3E family GTPase